MEQDSERGSRLSRRTFVAGTTAGFASVALAGCSGDGNGTPTTTAAQPENYVVTDDVIVSSSYVPENMGFVSACSPSRTFAPGMHPVFKVGVYDPATGEHLTNDDLESVTVNVEGYGSVDLAWSGDDDENPADEWSGSWAIPEDVEAGTLNYTVEITDGDANFRNVGIIESSLTVVDYARQFIVRDDVYTGSAGIPQDNAFVSSCQPERQFAPGMMVGFDVSVFEGTSGNPVGPGDSDIEGVVPGIASVEITIPDRDKTVTCEWSATENDDGEMVDLYWNGTWQLPEDIQPGELTYEIDIETDASWVDTPVQGAHTTNSFTIVSQ